MWTDPERGQRDELSNVLVGIALPVLKRWLANEIAAGHISATMTLPPAAFFNAINVTVSCSTRVQNGCAMYGYHCIDTRSTKVVVYTLDRTELQVLQTLVHECAHAVQQYNDPAGFDAYYDTYEYDANPYELSAKRAEDMFERAWAIDAFREAVQARLAHF